MYIGLHSPHRPSTTSASPSRKRRAAAINRPKAASAVVSVNTSGVWPTGIPLAVQADRSILSTPAAIWLTAASRGATSISSASIRSVSMQ